MKIVKNTTRYDTRHLRSVICTVHRYMTKLERRKAPRWSCLEIVIGNSKRGKNDTSGYAYYNGAGLTEHTRGASHGVDVFLGLPHEHCEVYRFARLVYHELMHTYGYNHSQYTNITMKELQKLFPENWEFPLSIKEEPLKKAAMPAWRGRYERALATEKRWTSKQKRATNALKKVRVKIKYYERNYELD